MILFREFKCFLQVLLFFLSTGHTSLNCCGITKLAPFPSPPFVCPSVNTYSYWSLLPPVRLPAGSPARLWALKLPVKLLMRRACCRCVAAAVCVAGRQAPGHACASGRLHSLRGQMCFPVTSWTYLYSVSDQRFLLPFITVALFHVLWPLESTLINQQCYLWGSKFPSLCHSLGSVFVIFTLAPWNKLWLL